MKGDKEMLSLSPIIFFRLNHHVITAYNPNVRIKAPSCMPTLPEEIRPGDDCDRVLFPASSLWKTISR